MLDVTKPTDQELNSTWPAWIRALHTYINTMEEGAPSNFAVTNLTISAGDTTLSIGVDLSDVSLEVIFVSGTGASNISYIYGGTSGQIKIFIFMDNTVSIQDGLKVTGQIYLNQLPVLSIMGAQENDVLVLVNVEGNGSSIFGWWKEMYRQVAVK